MRIMPKSTKGILLLIGIVFSTFLCIASPRQIRQLSRQIVDLRSETHLKEKQEELIALLKESGPLEIELYNDVITALERGQTFPLLKTHLPTVDRGMALFWKTPGFVPALHFVLTNPTNFDLMKGQLYELETALAIVDEGEETPWAREKILRFNMITRSRILHITREFDIVTTRRWVECKNVNWGFLPFDSTQKTTLKLKRQLTGQKQLVEDFNDHEGTRIQYEFCSKNPIPAEWQEWLIEQEITFYQEVSLTDVE